MFYSRANLYIYVDIEPMKSLTTVVKMLREMQSLADRVTLYKILQAIRQQHH